SDAVRRGGGDERVRRGCAFRLRDQLGGDPLRLKQALLFEPFVRVMLAQIVLACVTDDEDDETVCVERARDLQSCREVCAGRAAAEDAFLATKLARHLERFAVGDV